MKVLAASDAAVDYAFGLEREGGLEKRLDGGRRGKERGGRANVDGVICATLRNVPLMRGPPARPKTVLRCDTTRTKETGAWRTQQKE